MSASQTSLLIDDEMLRRWPLPTPCAQGDEEKRGRVLILAGSRETPGAALLSAVAALRAGAAKLTIAAIGSVCALVAGAVPESRVIALPETPGGSVALHAVDILTPLLSKADAILIGPGMHDEPAVCALVMALLPHIRDAGVILDACAMNVVRRQLQAVDATGGQQRYLASFARPVLLTPHAGAMAHLSGGEKDAVQANPLDAAAHAARRWNAIVALKGATTHIALPDGRTWRHEGSRIGLALCGASDTLAGIIVGLAARGAPLEQAAAWGVALHARAGMRLAQRIGMLGYRAGELAEEVPGLMQALGMSAAR